MSSNYTVTGIIGSLRQASYNRALMQAAIDAGPDAGLNIEIAEIIDVPFYNQDVEDAGVPESVVTLRAAVNAADGLLIATPEYNQSVPGVLKNAVDWLSRPPRPQAFDGKPVGVMGTTPGIGGTRAAQYHLRQSLTGLNALTMAQPMMVVPSAGSVFDDDGNLTDEKTAGYLRKFLSAFREWTGWVVNGEW